MAVQRVAVSKLRLSANNLPVESGRYSNIQRENRLGNFCNLGDVGDEFHNCMVCAQKEVLKLRKTFIQNLNLMNSNFQFLNKKSIFPYMILMADRSIITIISTYFSNVLKLYNLLIKQ